MSTENQLFLAIQQKKEDDALAIIEEIITAKAIGALNNRYNLDINTKEEGTENTALLKAIDFDLPVVAEKILEVDGIEINAQNKNGFTPLMKAINMGNAKENGFNSFIEKLLDRPDINVNLRNKDGEGALFLACYVLNSDAVKKILEISTDAIDWPTKYGKETPLMNTIKASLEIFDAPGARKTAKELVKDIAKCLIDALKNTGKDINRVDSLGYSAFSLAALHGYISILEELVRFPGIDINTKDEEGKTALDIAIKNNEDTIKNVYANKEEKIDSTDIVNFLKAVGAKKGNEISDDETSGGTSRKQSRIKRRASKMSRKKRGRKAKFTRRRKNRRVSRRP